MNSEIHLDHGDRRRASTIAEARNDYEQIHGHGVKNPNIQGQADKSLHTHWVGALAEVAVARLYGIEPELTYMTDGRGGRSYDLEIHGIGVEVKATERAGRSRLIVPKGRLRESEAYFLVYVSTGIYTEGLCRIRGWCWWHEVRELNEPLDLRPPALQKNSLYSVREGELRDAEEFNEVDS